MIPYAIDPDETPAPRLVHFVARARGGVALPPEVRGLSGEERLASILSSGQLAAFAVSDTAVPVLCMSDISRADLVAAFRSGLNARGRYEPWALVLNRELMFHAGARPVIYADQHDAAVIRKALADDSPRREAMVQRLDPVVYRKDWVHEREWRWIPAGPDGLAVWNYLDAVITGSPGWQPQGVSSRQEAALVKRWWWCGELIDDGLLSGPSLYE